MVDRPRILTGTTTAIETGCGTLYVTEAEGVNAEGQTYHEIKCAMGKSGGCQSCMMDCITGLLTLARTAKVSKKALINVMRGIICPNPRVSDGIRTLSCPDAIAVVLSAKGKELTTVPQVETPEEALAARPTVEVEP